MASETIMVPPMGVGALFRHQSFLLFFLGREFLSFACQISAVAVGWQIYGQTHSAFDLCMIGSVQFLPLAGLIFVAGHAADHYDRKRVVQICQIVEGTMAAALA